MSGMIVLSMMGNGWMEKQMDVEPFAGLLVTSLIKFISSSKSTLDWNNISG